MATAALALYVVALVVLFGVRTWLHARRTGSAGFHGISATPRQAQWWGGVLFIAAMILGLLGPLLAALDIARADAPDVVKGTGLLLALVGFAATLAGQSDMGASWRIGVDSSERTQLVTSGVFGLVRNPIFTAMIGAQIGVLLMVPNWISAAAVVALVAAVELQVRGAEEPYLAAVHGQAYSSYAARVGRFVPGIGRGHSAAGEPTAPDAPGRTSAAMCAPATPAPSHRMIASRVH
jgi:protein-S-isoprenylcysteine O-methyltransferase Ste14